MDPKLRRNLADVLTLDRVKASRPTADYDPRYGSNADQFIEAVYRSLGGKL